MTDHTTAPILTFSVYHIISTFVAHFENKTYTNRGFYYLIVPNENNKFRVTEIPDIHLN